MGYQDRDGELLMEDSQANHWGSMVLGAVVLLCARIESAELSSLSMRTIVFDSGSGASLPSVADELRSSG